MDPSRYETIVTLFERCLPLDEASRARLLDTECGDDADLRTQVEQMLVADTAQESAFDRPLVERVLDTLGNEPPPPERIGEYRIVREIGRGGMGIVYEARRDNGAEPIALKVLSAFGSLTLARRLRREAQLLSKLDHPGITRVLDTGVAEYRGLATPYLAMELVRGIRVDEYAATRRLSLNQRLDLLARIADAVQAAHDRGVIHRDLKPANILVVEGRDPAGEPKILDFGIARLREPQQDHTTLRTETGQILGTLNYMSPEQLLGGPTDDPRTDVYALGVIAFELLSGQHPVEMGGLTVVQAVAKLQQSRDPVLTVDDAPAPRPLETVISTALAREPSRRYASAAEFAVDLRGYLAGTGVVARPPSAAYQLREFARRNRLVVAVTLATLSTLSIGLVGTTLFGLSAYRNDQRSRWMSYRALVTAASAAIERADYRSARRMLEDCPPEHRAWEWAYLSELVADGMPVFAGVPVQDVCSHRAAGTVLGVADGRVLEWDPVTGAVRELPFAQSVRELSPSTSNGRVAATLDSGELVVFEITTGEVALRVPPEGGSPWAEPTMDGSGTRVWAQTPESGVVFEVATGTEISRQTIRSSAFSSRLSHDGDSILHTSVNAVTMLRRVDDGTARRVRHRSPGGMVAFSPDGTRFAVGSTLRDIYVFDTASLTAERVLVGHSGRVRAMVFASNDTLVSVFSDHTWRAWDVQTGEQQHAGPVEANSPVLAVAGDTLVVCDPLTGTATSWPLREEGVLDHPRFVYALGWSPGGGGLLASTAYEQGGTIVWDVASGVPVAQLDTVGRTLPTIEFTPDGTHLIHSHVRNGVQQQEAWDVANWTRQDEVRTLDDVFTLWNGRDGLQLAGIRFTPDGQTSAVQQSPKVWTVRRGNRVLAEIVSEDVIRAVAWSPDGKTLVVGSQPGHAVVAQAPDYEIVAELEHVTGLWSACFTPDGRRLVTGGDDGIIRVYDTATWDLIIELHGHADYVHAVAFDPRGQRMASGSGDGTIRIWDSASTPSRETSPGSGK